MVSLWRGQVVLRWVSIFLFLLLIARAAKAQSPSVSQSSSAEITRSAPSRFYLGYTAWFFLPSVRNLSRSEAPLGRFQNQNYLNPAYRISGDWWIRGQLRWDYNWGWRGRPSYRLQPVEFRDPFLGIQRSNVLVEKSHGVSLKARLQYYPGISRLTKIERGGTYDHSNGQLQAEFIGGRQFGDTSISFDFAWSMYRYFPSNEAPSLYNDYFLEIFNKVRYTFNEITNVYLGYNNYVNHFSNGRWAPWHETHCAEFGIVNRLQEKLYLITSTEVSLKGKDANVLALLAYRIL